MRAMFDDIARTYDLLNHGLSLNQDRRWRRRAVRLLCLKSGQRALDVCCGTGDLMLEMQRQQERCEIIGLDFSVAMLRGATQKTALPIIAGDALHLPFDDAIFDVVTVAFGARNFQDTQRGLAEMARVLKPHGKMLVLEFMRPRSPLLQRFFKGFNWILAPIGARISGHNRAYKYLPQSIGGFYTNPEFASLLRACGLNDVRAFDYSLGVATAFIARKSDGEKLENL